MMAMAMAMMAMEKWRACCRCPVTNMGPWLPCVIHAWMERNRFVVFALCTPDTLPCLYRNRSVFPVMRFTLVRRRRRRRNQQVVTEGLSGRSPLEELNLLHNPMTEGRGGSS